MDTITEKQQGTSLEVLQALRPGTQLQYWYETRTNGIPTFCATAAVLIGYTHDPEERDGRPVTSVVISPLSDRGKWLHVSPESIKPRLYGFEALTVPLPSGEVPAEFLADYVFGLGDLESVELIDTDDPDYAYLLFTDRQGNAELVYPNAFETCSCLPFVGKVVDYLRRNHFAVGLEPHQYIPLQP